MGCFDCKTTSTLSYPSNNDIKNEITETNNYKIKSNLNIPKNVDKLDLSNKLKDIVEYYSFLKMEFPLLEDLNLSNNNLSNISGLKELKAPKLRILNLNNNGISNLDIFRQLTFPLEELYLEGNNIKNVKIFTEIDILKHLKKCHLSIDDYESNKESLSFIENTIVDFKYETNKDANTKKIKQQIEQKVNATLKLNSEEN